MQTPSPLISFSSIKLTVLVTHDGVHYHDNERDDGRGEGGMAGWWRGGVVKNVDVGSLLMESQTFGDHYDEVRRSLSNLLKGWGW